MILTALCRIGAHRRADDLARARSIVNRTLRDEAITNDARRALIRRRYVLNSQEAYLRSWARAHAQ